MSSKQDKIVYCNIKVAGYTIFYLNFRLEYPNKLYLLSSIDYEYNYTKSIAEIEIKYPSLWGKITQFFVKSKESVCNEDQVLTLAMRLTSRKELHFTLSLPKGEKIKLSEEQKTEFLLQLKEIAEVNNLPWFDSYEKSICL